MADDFDSAVQQVAREKNGQAVTPDLFWSIVLALDKDSNARHRETLAMLTDHISGDKFRRLVVLIVGGISLLLFSIAGLEFAHQEQTAGILSLALPVVVVFGGWFISRARKE